MRLWPLPAAGQCLAQIRQRTADFTPPPDSCATWRALYEGLAELEKGMHRHIHLENNILFSARDGAGGALA